MLLMVLVSALGRCFHDQHPPPLGVCGDHTWSIQTAHHRKPDKRTSHIIHPPGISNARMTFLSLSVNSGPATEMGSSVSSSRTTSEHVASNPIPLTSSGLISAFLTAALLQWQIAAQMSSVLCS